MTLTDRAYLVINYDLLWLEVAPVGPDVAQKDPDVAQLDLLFPWVASVASGSSSSFRLCAGHEGPELEVIGLEVPRLSI